MRLTWKEMENLIFERFIRIFGDILEDFWTIFEEFEKLVHCEKNIKNFHRLETNKD